MEDIVIVESKDYAQVVFDDVKECYIENRPLECLFNLNELLQASSADTIGIYKVGFVNFTKDYVCSKPIDVEAIEQNKGKVVFDANSIPKDDGEFYQFVYVSQSKQIRGASVPFQFKKTHISDYIQVDDENNEAILIKSKEVAINETIHEMKSRCVNLTQANDTYEKLIRENEQLITSLQEEVAHVKLRCLKLSMDNEKLNYALKLKAESLNNLTTQLTSLNDENSKLQLKFDDLTNENKTLLESLQHRIDQVNQLKLDLQNVKLDQITRLEDQVNEKVDELTRIKAELKRNETIVSEQASTIQNILSERDALNCLIQRLTKEKNQLECSQENLSQELTMSKDKLMAAEQCKEMLRAQLVVLTNDLDAANSKIDLHLQTIKEHVNKERKFNEEKDELMKKIENMKLEYETKLEETNGSYYALKLAHVHLDSRLKTMEQSKVKLEKEKSEQKELIEKLQAENLELRERIQAGAKEYSKLYEKYRLIKNQQFNYDMNLYHDLNGADIFIRKDLNRNSQRFLMGTSTPNMIINNSENSSNQDSAIQTPARASSAEIENTLLDALLGSSFGWNNNASNNNINNLTLTNKNNTQSITTTTQPIKSAHIINDISDDGLNQNMNNMNLVDSHSSSNANSENNDLITLTNKLTNSCKPPLNLNLNTNTLNLVQQQTSNLRDEDDNVFTDSNENRFLLRTNNSNLPMTPAISKNQIKLPLNSNPSAPQMLDGLNINSCDICNYIFPTDADIGFIEKHYSIHYGPSCPVCFMLFHKGYPQKEFEDHVNSHFSN